MSAINGNTINVREYYIVFILAMRRIMFALQNADTI